MRRDHHLADQIEAKGIEYPLGLANSLRGMGSGAQPSLWEELPRLKLPTQLIAGQLDRKFVRINREMAAAMPPAAMKAVPNAGHRVHLENPTAWHATVLSFLRGL